MSTRGRLRALAALALGALLPLLVVATSGSPAQGRTDKGLVEGEILFPQKDSPAIKLLWFDADWHYLGQKRANGGGYSLRLPAGRYHLQFVDQRPSYDVRRYAPTDVAVTVRADNLSARNVRMERGSVITGTVRTGGRPGSRARVVAARTDQLSYSTVADSRGRFALGGLPPGKYCLFTFDHAHSWVGKCTWAGKVVPGKPVNLAVRLTKRAGNLTVHLFTPSGWLDTRTNVTITSRQTGQWWSATARHGTAVFRGVYPGRYRLRFDGAGIWLPTTGTVQQGEVKSGRMAFGAFHLTKRGAWVTGSLVDAGNVSFPLEPSYDGATGALVSLYDRSGAKIASAFSDDHGRFTIAGQLLSQSGLTIVVDPGAQTGGYMRGQAYCHFDHLETDGYAITTGQPTDVGALEVPRTAGQRDPGCASPVS